MLIAELFHPLAARITVCLFLLIWTSAVAAGFFADRELLSFVKEVVVWAMFVLVPVAMITAMTGLMLTRVRPGPITARKRKRLRLIAGVSVAVLLPSMLGLDALAQSDHYDATLFLVVQGIELTAGLIILGLMGLSVRDGILAKREAARAAQGS